ncbi:dihydrofolate synthase [Alternaria panax]|uniref:Dihydrofolate synthase n=1 Tax=Alternaria panax TaxID=48097 RepID=A0AAD4FIZ9_9PLEO|nr:dihydrofolate synthase [Alternaria panax]
MAMIQPGLERISQLVKNVHFPWKSIHVAGTNGKGSICHFASTLLSKRLKCGKFTSPHLMDRWDCISINNKPVEEALFRKIEKHYIDLNIREGISASNFEILTATAFHIFNEEQVQIGVIEVGMGGKLDATNILNNQAISVISKIARDHESFLGSTLGEIAHHKAGILRPDVPYLVNPKNERNVKRVINDYAREISAGPDLEYDPPGFSKILFQNKDWLPPQPVMQENMVMAAIAAQTAMKSLGRELRTWNMAHMLRNSKAVNPGRLESVRVPPIFGGRDTMSSRTLKGEYILVDGAHNPDAARLLGEHVQNIVRRKKIPDEGRAPYNGWPVTWVLAMTEGKDAHEYLEKILRPGDNVVATTFGPVDGMPWVKPMDPNQLLDMARSVKPAITGLVTSEDGPLRALCTANYLRDPKRPIVLTGSLYLVADLHRELRLRPNKVYWDDPKSQDDRNKIAAMLEEEKHRVNRLLSGTGISDRTIDRLDGMDEKRDVWKKQQAEQEKRRAIQEEIAALNREMESLTEEEKFLAPEQSPAIAGTKESNSLPPRANLENGARISYHKTW